MSGSGALANAVRAAGAFGLAAVVSTASLAAPVIDPPFTEGAVVQRDAPLAVSGSSEPGNRVEVSFHGHVVMARADSSGRWRARLPAMPAHAEPSALVARDADGATRIADLRVGDVWMVAGQSNAGWALQHDGADNGVLRRAPVDPALRLFRVPPRCAKSPVSARGAWTHSDWTGARNFSALGYHFGQALRARAPDVPVGIVQVARGGSPLAAWLPPAVLKDAAPEAAARRRAAQTRDREAVREHAVDARLWLDAFARAPEAAPPPPVPDLAWTHVPGCYWDGMLWGLRDVPVAGMLWYQGETDATRGTVDYGRRLRAFLQAVRRGRGNLPVVVFGLPPLDTQPRTEIVRAAQKEVAATDPLTVFVPAEAPGHDPLELHPRNKRDPAQRAAAIVGKAN